MMNSTNKLSQKLIYLFLAVLIVSTPLPSKAYTTDRVVLVIIDGLRYSEGLGDPNHTYTPRMAALANQGALVDNFRNDGVTKTWRAIPAIWCGAWTEINTFSDPYCGGSNNNTTELPTVFEYYRKQLNRPADDCIYTIKNLCSWKASHDVDYGPDYWPLYHEAGTTDTDVWQETEQVIATQSPRLLLMYLADVDHAGHVGDWNDYLKSIVTADSLVGRLWEVLQADTAYAGKTTLLVTNDHGRHDWDFTGHGDGCEGCRHIQLLAVGPDVRTGLRSDVTRTIPDIAPTIGELLGFTTEKATGTAMTELFTDVVHIDRSQRPEIQALKVFPNPSNQGTTIEISLPIESEIELQVYDLKGRLVTTINRYLGAGLNQISWNGTDNHGREISSGTYLIRLQADNDVSLGKIVLIK